MKKKILSIACVLVSAITFAQVPTDGLVAHYPFNGNAKDESTNSNDGTVNGATLTEDRFGNVNSAYSFDGVDDKIIVQHAEIQNSFPLTISVWFKTIDSFPNNRFIVGKYECLSYNGYSVFINSEGVATSYYYNNYPNGATIGSQKINDGKWHSLITVFDEVGQKYYVDNVLVTEQSYNGTVQATSTNTNLAFGFYPKGACQVDNYIKGSIDDVSIYNRALDSIEIQNIFNYSESSCTDTNYVNVNNYIDIYDTTFIRLADTNYIDNYVDIYDTIRIEVLDTNLITFNDTVYHNVYDTTAVTVFDTLEIYLSTVLSTVYDESLAASTIKVYPNPTSKNLTVDFDNPSNLSGMSLKILTNQSVIVYQKLITGSTQSIDVNSWTAGVYFLHVMNGSKTVDIRKIVVNN